MDGAFGPHRPPAVPERTRIHAAPTELGGLCRTCGYKHGAPNGAFRIAPSPLRRVEDAGKEQQLAGDFPAYH